jgi:MinD-like ATPase involved in chromosome partitioning or flagellar assembly
VLHTARSKGSENVSENDFYARFTGRPAGLPPEQPPAPPPRDDRGAVRNGEESPNGVHPSPAGGEQPAASRPRPDGPAHRSPEHGPARGDDTVVISPPAPPGDAAPGPPPGQPGPGGPAPEVAAGPGRGPVQDGSPAYPPGPGAPPGSYPGPASEPYPAVGGARHASASVGPLRASIRPADLVKPYKEEPETGWRKALHRTTRINLGPSPAERAWNDLRHRVTRNLRGTYLVGVLQEKGGVSKTTVTVCLGSALAHYRDDKIVGIDANPASGNLAKRIDEPSQGTWRGLILDEHLESYSDYRHYLGKSSSSGFEVLAADRGDEVITGHQLRELWRRLARQYPVGLIDCGNQLRDDVAAMMLSLVDAIVVPTTTRLDGVEGAAETLNWLIEHGYPHLVRNAVLLISNINREPPSPAVKKVLGERFEKAVRAVHHVPFDPHLSDATAIDFNRLKPETRRAYIEAAASLVDGFAAAADKHPGGYRERGI